MEMKDKIFVVSGAGSGLGKATTELLCEEGAKVIAIDIKVDQATLDKWSDNDILYRECDVRLPENVSDAIESGVSHFDGLDGAVACAGIAPAIKIHSSRKGSHPYDDFANTLAINLGGTFNLFNNCVPYLKKNPATTSDKERGCLIATSSIAAYEGQIGQAAYAASKGGVSSMILPLAREMARSGIRVNAIAPGIFQTPMVDAFPEKVQEALANEVPFPQRLGQPNEFAQLVRHIITNQYINGTVIRLDGSVRMR